MFWSELHAENKELRETIRTLEDRIAALVLSKEDTEVSPFVKYLEGKISRQRKEITRLLNRLTVGPDSFKTKAVKKEVDKQLLHLENIKVENIKLRRQTDTYKADIKSLSEDNEALRKELLGDKKSSERISNKEIREIVNKCTPLKDVKVTYCGKCGCHWFHAGEDSGICRNCG